MNRNLPLEETSRRTETQVGQVDNPPTDETANGCQINEPAENGVSTAGDDHESKEGER